MGAFKISLEALNGTEFEEEDNSSLRIALIAVKDWCMKAVALALIFLNANFAQAQNCGDLFVSDAALLVSWGVELKQTQKLAAQGRTQLLHSAAEAIRLVEGAPRNFFRLMSLIVPYAALPLTGNVLIANPFRHDLTLARELWDQLGFSLLGEFIEKSDPEWQQAYLTNPSRHLMAYLTTAAARLQPLMAAHSSRRRPDELLEKSIRRMLKQEQISGDQYSDLMRHSRMLREAVVGSFINPVSRTLTNRELSPKEQGLIMKAVIWKLAYGTPAPFLPEDLIAQANSIVRVFDVATSPPNAHSFEEPYIALVKVMAASLAVQLRKIKKNRNPLDVLRILQSFLLEDADQSTAHLPLLFSSVMAALIPVGWQDPDQIRENLAEGLRVQFTYLDQAP